MTSVDGNTLALTVYQAGALLVDAGRSALLADDYDRAARRPLSHKYDSDAFTLGVSRCIRRAGRSFDGGKVGLGVKYVVAAPLAALAFMTCLPPFGSSIVRMELESRLKEGKIGRSQRGVREDKVWRAVNEMTKVVDTLLERKTRFMLDTGELSYEELRTMGEQARVCSQQAREDCDHWREGKPHDGVKDALRVLDKKVDELTQLIRLRGPAPTKPL